jgi:prolyl-tRNA synthetase
MSTLFLRTLRQDPADAEVPSHRLLVRAGYIRRVAAGVYTLLPLGKRVVDRVAAVVREEMDAIGGQEILLPALLPREPYDRTGRWDDYGPELFRLADRRGGDYLLGPTHEEMMTLLVKGEYSSYRDLPLVIYQIQTKYRDELRPRSGIIRGREFLMKDSYSFTVDEAGLERAYADHRAAYQRIFTRLGLDYRIVAAMSGAMGGSASEEFLAPTPVGEDTFVTCAVCGYAANEEAADVGVGPDWAGSGGDHPPMTELPTPGAPNVEPLVAHLVAAGVPVTAGDVLKTLLFRLDDGELVAVLVPGDREVDPDRLAALVTPRTATMLTDEDFAARPDLVRGYVGPGGMAGRGVRVLADVRVVPGSAWVTGANRSGYHVLHAVAGRDFAVDTTGRVAAVAAGDPCPVCGSPLALDRAIEIGHIFQLGRKYTDAFGFDVSGPDGAAARVTMGSYGIGVSRAVAAIAEQNHDESGLVWPASVAPYDVHVVPVGKNEAVRSAAASIAAEADAAGMDVLLDDRGVAAGVAFADADLIGVPTIVIVGKALADGEVEIYDRTTGRRDRVPVAGVVARITPVGDVPGAPGGVSVPGAPGGVSEPGAGTASGTAGTSGTAGISGTAGAPGTAAGAGGAAAQA